MISLMMTITNFGCARGDRKKRAKFENQSPFVIDGQERTTMSSNPGQAETNSAPLRPTCWRPIVAA